MSACSIIRCFFLAARAPKYRLAWLANPSQIEACIKPYPAGLFRAHPSDAERMSYGGVKRFQTHNDSDLTYKYLMREELSHFYKHSLLVSLFSLIHSIPHKGCESLYATYVVIGVYSLLPSLPFHLLKLQTSMGL